MQITPNYDFTEPTVAIFPFPWYENAGMWMMKALKVQPEGDLKWKRHYVLNERGYRRLEVFDAYDLARAAACEFNVGTQDRINGFVYDEDIRQSLLLKAEKEITTQQRLLDEEQLMLEESLRRSRLLPKPLIEKLTIEKFNDNDELKRELHALLCQMPKLGIAQMKSLRLTLLRKGELSWPQVLVTNKKTGMYFWRDCIATGFGLSGTSHWGKTKASIRAMLLPRANQLLQLASVKKILDDALAHGLRIVVLGGFVLWYEDNGDCGWMVKSVGSDAKSEKGITVWHEGTIVSRNHGRIVVLPYIKENGERVHGHTKNAPADGKAVPRHSGDYLELPFRVLEGDLMRGLFGELHYD